MIINYSPVERFGILLQIIIRHVGQLTERESCSNLREHNAHFDMNQLICVEFVDISKSFQVFLKSI